MVPASFVQVRGVAAIVPALDEGTDGGDEIFDAGEAAAADGLRVMIPKKISTGSQRETRQCPLKEGLAVSDGEELGCTACVPGPSKTGPSRPAFGLGYRPWQKRPTGQLAG
jgi:hypothetical protein